MIDVETSIEPPVLDPEPDEDDEPTVQVHASMIEGDGTHRAGYTHMPASAASDERIADALIDCLRAVAVMRGPGLTAAVARRIR